MKYYGKEKCRILKEIRAEIARQNEIEWVVSECKHQGDCKGTCPRCEAEVLQLEQELDRRAKLGKCVAVAGISAAMTLSITGCDMSYINPFATTAGKPMSIDGVYPEQEVTTSSEEFCAGEVFAESELGEVSIPMETCGDEPEMGEPVLPGVDPDDGEDTESDTEETTSLPEILMGDIYIPEDTDE